MGKVRTKVIETAIEPEKLEKQKEVEVEPIDTKQEKTKKPAKTSKIKVRSKRYKELLTKIDKPKEYPVQEAIEIIKKTTTTSFESNVESHINLGLSPEKSEHQIRVNLTLPHSTPQKASKAKSIKILVFTDKNKEEIKKLRAEIGTDETLKEIEKGKIEFGKIIADPSWMSKLAKVAKVLGPKDLMPNPKSGTVTEDVLKAVKEFSGGKTQLRMEKSPIIHTNLGNASLDNQKIKENLTALVNAIQAAKPEGFKKQLIKSVYLSSTMGPSVKVDPATIQS